MSKIADVVAELAGPIAEKHGCQIWNVEYVKEAGCWYLRVYIDRPDGVSIDLCEAVSRELDPLLDAFDDLIPDSYIFEISSAGAERWLRGPHDFERFAGRPLEVKLYKAIDGKKKFSGELAAWDDNGVELAVSGGRLSFAKSDVAGVRLRLTIND